LVNPRGGAAIRYFTNRFPNNPKKSQKKNPEIYRFGQPRGGTDCFSGFSFIMTFSQKSQKKSQKKSQHKPKTPKKSQKKSEKILPF
jgi:hypothetical protein